MINKEIYLAGGCFWGTEHFLGLIPGVKDTHVGYANSNKPNPHYNEVRTGHTGAVETVKVSYDDSVVSLADILGLFFNTIDPTFYNRQGEDVGSQYRTGIYFTDPADQPVIKESIDRLAARTPGKVVIEVMPLRNFYPAEAYHQDYLYKNPGGYCHIDPSLFDLARNSRKERRLYPRPSDEVLRSRLTSMQYQVTQHAATEPPYRNEYNSEFRPGLYVDIVTGEPLFASSDKFESGCGWPAFTRPVSEDVVVERRDLSHGMDRIEVVSRSGSTHLGHVFQDGPNGGRRYCINSASLKFVPVEEMKAQGYGEYISLIS